MIAVDLQILRQSQKEYVERVLVLEEAKHFEAEARVAAGDLGLG